MSNGPIFLWELIYQAKTQPVSVKEDIARFEWTNLWAEPVRVKRGLPAHQQQFITQSLFPVAAAAKISAGGIIASGPVFQRKIIYQVSTRPLGVFQARDSLAWFAPLSDPIRRKPTLAPDWPLIPQQTVVTVTWDDWTNWPDFAPRAKAAVNFQPWTFIPPPAQVFSPYAPWDDFARRKPQPLDTQPLAWPPTPVATPFPSMGWINWPDFAPRAKRVADFIPWAFVPPPAQVWFPYGPWDDFTRRKPQPLDTQPLAWPATPIVAPVPPMGWTQWPDFALKKAAALNYVPLTFVQTVTSPFNSFTQWPDFLLRAKPTVDFKPWSFVPAPVQVWFPYGPWDDFARRKPQPLDTQPLIWSSFTPPPGFFLVPDRWPDLIYRKPVPLNFVPLTLVQTVQAPWTQWTQWPDRIWKKSPPVETQPLAYLQTVRTPWNEMSRWPELVPIRGKKGLLIPQHPAFFMFPGKITGVTVSIIMAAHEVNADTALWAINVLSSPPPSAVSAAVSIEEGFGSMVATSIVEH